jgi:8-oxo-dGTP diphosphatase
MDGLPGFERGILRKKVNRLSWEGENYAVINFRKVDTEYWTKSMDVDRIIFQTEWIAVKQSPREFQHLERKGKDSVAVFLLRKSGANSQQYEVLIRQQHLCIDNRKVDGKFRLFPCPITGALDEGESAAVAAQREVYEERGYRVQVSPLGRYIVSLLSF